MVLAGLLLTDDTFLGVACPACEYYKCKTLEPAEGAAR